MQQVLERGWVPCMMHMTQGCSYLRARCDPLRGNPAPALSCLICPVLPRLLHPLVLL